MVSSFEGYRGKKKKRGPGEDEAEGGVLLWEGGVRGVSWPAGW